MRPYPFLSHSCLMYSSWTNSLAIQPIWQSCFGRRILTLKSAALNKFALGKKTVFEMIILQKKYQYLLRMLIS